MTEYLIPTQSSQTEFVEKRSRFIGRVQPVKTEAEARAFIEQIRKKHYDARHNCWCYLLREEGVVRYSDDGEPQGTAGQPMLGVFEKEGGTDLVCVVTRYFGGILLGAGGLVRAYTRSAKDALDAAGISVVRRWVRLRLPCPYHLYERLRLEFERYHGEAEETDYAAEFTFTLLIPEELGEEFSARLTDMTAGNVAAEIVGESLQPAPFRTPR